MNLLNWNKYFCENVYFFISCLMIINEELSVWTRLFKIKHQKALSQ